MYSSFIVRPDLTVELYKYLYPRESNPNDDGLIYRITHNGVSYLLLREINELDGKLASLPTLKSDVIKWPHHAHIEDNKRANNIIMKLNTTVDPRFIIWQTHSAQNAHSFEEYINQNFDFHDKFKCSDTVTFKFISLLNFFNVRRAS